MQAIAAERVGGTQVTIRLPEELRERLEESADRNDRTLSQELRRAIRWYVALEQQQ